MSERRFQATITGIPSRDTVNVRSGAGTTFDQTFQVPKGMSGLEILEVQPDVNGREKDGKTYQWFKLQFHGGATGWVRDDLITVEGDGTRFGYPNLGTTASLAFDLTRGDTTPPATAATAQGASPAPPATTTTSFTATLSGSAALDYINARPEPGTHKDPVGKLDKGLSGLKVLDVQPDVNGREKNGKVYQWFKLQTSLGDVWVRDDLVTVQGDGTPFDYPNLGTNAVLAIDLTRGDTTPPATAAQVTITTSEKPPEQHKTDGAPSQSEKPQGAPAQSSGATVDSVERVKKASFLITATFEGSGYAAYNNYDAGIVSYGLIQFTLAAGSLGTVIEKYLNASQSETAKALQAYWSRVQQRDPSLRNDGRFKELLIAAASEPEMQKAQDEVATIKYWNAVMSGYIEPRGLKTPLAWALLFDMGVNFGTGHGFVRLAEEQLGVPKRSRPGENGITEEQLITRVAELRKKSHDAQAERDNLPGLKVRGDFWMKLIQQGDWGLQGDSNGNINVRGRLIQVRNL
ncbi:MAG: hypothetical protein D6712_15420 [Chloroflexi bacterium]|nr:MAG: hypothetical protein D6712_15420 [Chloroflexota bacterium]